MNMLLLAAQEDDVEAISRNIFEDLLCKYENNRFSLLCRALKNHSIHVVRFFLTNKLLSPISYVYHWIDAYKSLGDTKGDEKKYLCFELLVQNGGYASELVSNYINYCVWANDTKGALQALTSSEMICNLKLDPAADTQNFKVFWTILLRLHLEEGLDESRQVVFDFHHCVHKKYFDFAFFIYEVCKGFDFFISFIKKNPSQAMTDFFTYHKIYKRSQIRAVNKIYFWWIPICYRNKEFRLKMAEKSFDCFFNNRF